MFNQSKVVPTVLSTTPKMYIYPTKSQKSPLFTFQPILWRHSRFFPYLAEIGLEPRVKRHIMNVLSPDRKQSKVYAAAASYETHIYICNWIVKLIMLVDPCRINWGTLHVWTLPPCRCHGQRMLGSCLR